MSRVDAGDLARDPERAAPGGPANDAGRDGAGDAPPAPAGEHTDVPGGTDTDVPGGKHADAPGDRGPLRLLLAGIREILVILAMALVLSFVVKTWLVQAFFIPSGSMEDTLLVGDRVIVSKLTPGPLELSRGDVVVFEDPGSWLPQLPLAERSGVSGALHDGLVFVGLLPAESEDHLIKRVIGLPGDHVVCCGESGRLSVNGVEVDEPYVREGDVPSSLTFDITVPAGHVWVMGDHRSDSEDSRFHDEPSADGSDGSVPAGDVTGRAVSVVWPLHRIGWLSHHPETFADVPAGRPDPS